MTARRYADCRLDDPAPSHRTVIRKAPRPPATSYWVHAPRENWTAYVIECQLKRMLGIEDETPAGRRA